MSNQTKELFEFGDFRLNVGERKLERLNGGRANESLRDKAFEVLVHLIRNNGRLVTKDELLSVAWPDTVVEEANLSKAIYAIRQFLGEATNKQKYIETVPKHGYRFVADVRKIDKVNAPNGSVDASTAPSQAGPPNGTFAQTQTTKLPTDEIVSSPDAKNKGGVVKEDARKPGPPAFRVSPVVLIGVLGFGGLLVANNWRSPQISPQDASVTNAPSDTGNSNAYDLYVRGKVKAGNENREETEAAIKLLEEAVAIDPNFAEAYAQLARVYNTMSFKFASDAEQKRFSENAEVAIEKALALNPDLAEAHLARGLILWTSIKRFPHEQAIRSYKRSLELDPKQDETHHQLSMVYAHIGLMDEAELELSKALELNPNNTMARYRTGNYLVWQGKSEEALVVLKTVPSEVSPLLVERIKAEALIHIGRLSEAEAIVDAYLSRNPTDEGGSFTSLKALILAKSGKHEEAEAAIARSIEIGKGFGHFHHTAYNVASAYAIMNKPDEALRWLQDAADDGFPCYSYLEVDHNLDGLRKDPRFIDFMTKGKMQIERYRALVNN